MKQKNNKDDVNPMKNVYKSFDFTNNTKLVFVNQNDKTKKEKIKQSILEN